MSDAQPTPGRNQTRLFAVIFVVMLAFLGAGYFLFMRSDYVVLYSDLKPGEAAALVTELDRRGANYRLGQGGTSILVPKAEADEIRVGVAGAELATSGDVGFEVFNESSMGLTDFAQKINFQRALQGELSRTIMSMEGVESARVHLALPERALYRTARSEPRAAVTVIPKRGQLLDEPRVLGIQRLVASSVPELPLTNVIVLDGFGRVVSSTPPPEQLAGSSQFADEQQRYRAKVREAVAQAVPGLTFEVELLVAPVADMVAAAAPAAAGAGYRAFKLNIAIITPSPVRPDNQAAVLNAVREAVGLDESAGDRLSFRTALPPSPGTLPLPAPPPAAAAAPPAPPEAPGILWALVSDYWASLLALLGIAAVLIMGRSRAAASARAEHEDLIRRIRLQLHGGSAAHG